jgi:hypothetical protein
MRRTKGNRPKPVCGRSQREVLRDVMLSAATNRSGNTTKPIQPRSMARCGNTAWAACCAGKRNGMGSVNHWREGWCKRPALPRPAERRPLGAAPFSATRPQSPFSSYVRRVTRGKRWVLSRNSHSMFVGKCIAARRRCWRPSGESPRCSGTKQRNSHRDRIFIRASMSGLPISRWRVRPRWKDPTGLLALRFSGCITWDLPPTRRLATSSGSARTPG